MCTPNFASSSSNSLGMLPLLIAFQSTKDSFSRSSLSFRSNKRKKKFKFLIQSIYTIATLNIPLIYPHKITSFYQSLLSYHLKNHSIKQHSIDSIPYGMFLRFVCCYFCCVLIKTAEEQRGRKALR